MSSPVLYLAGGGSDSRSAPGPREKRGGIEIQNPLPAPGAPEGWRDPGLPRLLDRQLGCSIRPVLQAPPTRAHREPRELLTPPPRRRSWAWAGAHKMPWGTASPTALAESGEGEGQGTGRERCGGRCAGCGRPGAACVQGERCFLLHSLEFEC